MNTGLTKKNQVLAGKIMRLRKCAASTSRVWASTLRRINRDFSDQKWNNDLKWIDTLDIMDKIKKFDSLNVKRNLGNAYAVGLELVGSKLKPKVDEWLKTLRIKKLEETKKQGLSARQKKNMIGWNDVVNLKNTFARNVRLKNIYTKEIISNPDFNTLQQHLVLHLYTDMNPIRLDFSDVLIYSEQGFAKLGKAKLSGNFLVTHRGKWKFYFYKFKSAKFYSLPVVLNAPRAIVSILKKHIPILKKRFKTDIPYLLYNRNGTKLSRNSLSKLLTNMFQKAYDKRIGSQMLRTIFLTHKYRGHDILERENTAQSMMHKRSTQEAHYIKKIE